MSLLADFFSNEPFDLLSLTESLANLPYQENMLGSMGLYEGKGQLTDIVEIDETDGIIQILETRQRGEAPQRATAKTKRKARLLKVPHFPFEDRVSASALQGLRETGEINLVNAVNEINNRMTWMKQQLENTREIHRLNALKGILVDKDATVLYNYFDEFEVVADTANFEFTSSTLDVRNEAVEVVETIEDTLGGIPFRGTTALCGRDWFKAFIAHESVKDTYRYQQGQQNRADLRDGFEFAGTLWKVYRGFRGLSPDIGAIDDDEALLFPDGVAGMFREIWAPGDFLETVNTMGQPMYAKTEATKYNKAVDIFIETNTLFLNTRPKTVITLTKS